MVFFFSLLALVINSSTLKISMLSMLQVDEYQQLKIRIMKVRFH